MKGSVVILGIAIFVVLALAIYIFRSFPYLLALVLLAEWIVLALAVLGPLVAPNLKKGWIGRIVAVMLTLGLANIYMLFLANHWGVQPAGWYRATLTFPAAVLGFGLHLVGYVIVFLDALLKAVLGLSRGPIESLLGQVGGALRNSMQGPLSIGAGVEGLRLGQLMNVVVGVLASLFSAVVLKGLLPSAKATAGHGGGGAHH